MEDKLITAVVWYKKVWDCPFSHWLSPNRSFICTCFSWILQTFTTWYSIIQPFRSLYHKQILLLVLALSSFTIGECLLLITQKNNIRISLLQHSFLKYYFCLSIFFNYWHHGNMFNCPVTSPHLLRCVCWECIFSSSWWSPVAPTATFRNLKLLCYPPKE